MTRNDDIGSQHQPDGRPAVDAKRRDLLDRLGFAGVEHDSHVPFLSHLVGVHRILREWGSPRHLCDAGLFHSAYGTEYFEPDGAVADRATVVAVIGARAEHLARLWCVLERQSIDLATRSGRDRSSGDQIDFGPGVLEDVATLWAADVVEQIERMTPDEWGFANGLDLVEHLARPPARAALRRLPAAHRGALAATVA